MHYPKYGEVPGEDEPVTPKRKDGVPLRRKDPRPPIEQLDLPAITEEILEEFKKRRTETEEVLEGDENNEG